MSSLFYLFLFNLYNLLICYIQLTKLISIIQATGPYLITMDDLDFTIENDDNSDNDITDATLMESDILSLCWKLPCISLSMSTVNTIVEINRTYISVLDIDIIDSTISRVNDVSQIEPISDLISRKRKNSEISSSVPQSVHPQHSIVTLSSSSSLETSSKTLSSSYSSSSSLKLTSFPLASSSSPSSYLSVVPSTSLYTKLTMTTGN